MSGGFTIPSEYGWILLECGIIVTQMVTIGYSNYSVRQRIFNKAFFDRHFPEMKPPPVCGYPDDGHGRFADRLSDAEWIEFNSYQRAHYNYLEHAPAILTNLLVSGLYYPRFTAVCGAVYIIGRTMYTIGYQSKGPEGRMMGALTLDLALVAATGSSLMAAFQIGGGFNGLSNFVTSYFK